MARISRGSLGILNSSLQHNSPDRAIPVEQVLEEEFAKLHPGETIRSHAHPDRYDAGDIAYPVDMAAVLLNAVRTLEEAVRPSGWSRQPPAPPSTELQHVAEFIVTDAAELVDALRTHDADAMASDKPLREAIAARLNALIQTDLLKVVCFEQVVEQLREERDDEFSDDEPVAIRSKRILDAAFEPYLATTCDKRLEAVMAHVRRSNHIALCLSGGGIRSASFAFGIIQGLGRYKLLQRFHYLSTVSGGGFAGGWLSAWMSRSGVTSVLEHLEEPATVKIDDEPPPLRHVRTFSRYLNPQLGLMSADTWTLIASGVRNILLMWVVMLPLMAAPLMIPRLFVAWPMTTLEEWAGLGIDPGTLTVFLFVVATLLLFASLRHMHRYLRRTDDDWVPPSDGSTLGAFHTRCLIPLVLGVAILSEVWELFWAMFVHSPGHAILITHSVWAAALIDWQAPRDVERNLGIVLISVYGFVLAVTSWIAGSRKWYQRPIEGLGCAAAGALAGALVTLFDDYLFGIRAWHVQPAAYATFAVPSFLALSVVGTQIFTGVLSRTMSDADREAAARLNAWMLIVIVAWIGSFSLALYGPEMGYALVNAPSHIVLTVLVSAIAGLLAAHLGAKRSSRDIEQPSIGGRLGTFLAAIAAPTFAATVIVLISALNKQVLALSCRAFPAWCPADHGAYDIFTIDPNRVLTAADYAQPQLVLLAAGILFVVGLMLSWMIDTNRFSLHAIYAVRLIRTFIGASKAPSDRAADPFTGFDRTDDMPISNMWPAKEESAPRYGEGATGHPPLHVINMTLNMVSSKRLATQERKAESFTITPLHAGSHRVGYRRTSGGPRLYGGKDGITLGTAIAVSGAAASPNAGAHSSPVITFLMALFNLRLGRWLGNPGPSGNRTFDKHEPELGFLPIINEMFGRTTDRSAYVYLSDGAHFENLGLYEMVYRRCKLIVVSDAGCDPEASFDDLGGAIRKIRIDFGIPIEFDDEMAIYPRSMPERATQGVYWAVGRIRYSAVDRDAPLSPDRASSEEDGILLYLKPAFYGREPRDVYNYASRIPEFPHESTGNQFYGEEQFESYRALGAHVIEELCAKEFNVPRAGHVTAEALDAWIAGKVGSLNPRPAATVAAAVNVAAAAPSL